jgi:hypothetical protein
MYERFQPWVLATYGDSAKTKTITKAGQTNSLEGNQLSYKPTAL